MNNYRIFLMALSLLSLFGLSACANKGINLVKTGAVSVSTHSSGQVEIINVYVKKMENEVLIHADARPTEAVRFFHPGHLIFEMTSADGEQIFNFDITRYTREHNDGERRSKMKHVSFWVRMPIEIPNGAKLAVSHHSSSVHENKNE